MTFQPIGAAAARVVANLTPYAEGHRAGYRDEPKNNPYLRGVTELAVADMVRWSLQWDAGYEEGQRQGRDDVIMKHRENCR